MSLLKNALKFTRQGRIEVKAMYQNERNSTKCLKVDISDTGAGIDPSDIDMLFTRFGKLQRSADINSEGIGLGLTISQQIV
jgi:two-component system, sensor histidine kinase